MTKVQCEYTVTREVAGLKLNRQQVWKQKQKQKQSSHCLAVCHRLYGHLIRNGTEASLTLLLTPDIF